ncbi:hypothetical protein [Archangium sp.]|uniref:hypothetical protein n=1 Tax=Archangium sp. TaxID=1872627 RepID=UPI002ED9D978
MKLPAFVHGTHATVKPRCRKKAKALVEGATWEELSSDWLDTSEVADLLVLEGPSPLMGKQPHFQLFDLGRALLEGLAAAPSDEVNERAFRSALDSPWSLLCFMGQHASFFVSRGERQLPFLEACSRHWAELDGVGERYSTGAPAGQRLWNLTTPIKLVLGQRGLSRVLAEKPLSAEGLAPLVEQVREVRLPAPRRAYTPGKD